MNRYGWNIDLTPETQDGCQCLINTMKSMVEKEPMVGVIAEYDTSQRFVKIRLKLGNHAILRYYSADGLEGVLHEAIYIMCRDLLITLYTECAEKHQGSIYSKLMLGGQRNVR